jgi:hypothetical protein
MKLHCYRCDHEVNIIVLMSGPHLKAVCPDCQGYIKFLCKAEKIKLEKEEDGHETIDYE